VTAVKDRWEVGEAYEAYVGRWSRRVAADFVDGLGVAAGGRWLDAGCGTGALAGRALEVAAPIEVTGVDPSTGFLRTARERLGGSASFVAADARRLPFGGSAFDAVVGGLMLNFVPEPARAVAEFARVADLGGTVAAYVWDYADGMRFMRYFWDAAAAVDPASVELDEGRRFALCAPGPLADLWRDAGLADVDVRPIEIPTVFADFDDFWQPFLGGQGSAPTYVSTLDDARRDALRETLRAALPTAADGSIPLTARAWAVSGLR
jgi:SAM-dependent methyltransferase